MSEVQRFWSHEASNIRCVREADFDRVQAENRELQARLTVQDQREDDLKGLLQGWLYLFPKQGVAGGPITTMKERTISALNPTAEAASHE